MNLKETRDIITIDATSTVSGGGVTYLLEFLNESTDLFKFNVICSKSIAEQIPSKENIKIFTHKFLNRGIFYRFIFQLFFIDRFIDSHSIILISLSGDYIGKFHPYIGVCQNMLLYEDDKRKGMKVLEKLKFEILKLRQLYSFFNSDGVVFLSEHAKKVVSNFIKIKNSTIINFGISKRFLNDGLNKIKHNEQLNLLYVSSIHTYKNQLNLLYAIEDVIKHDNEVYLTLIGPILDNSYWKLVKKQIDKINNIKKVVTYKNFVDFKSIHKYYEKHNVFVFPSICENMPNILIEAMASGLPILSSKNEPMPEFIGENAIFFDPDDVQSIVKKILYSLNNKELLNTIASKNQSIVKKYNWKENFDKTILFINKTISNV